jgi:ribosomal-protein-alanine N-acetyltransferase
MIGNENARDFGDKTLMTAQLEPMSPEHLPAVLAIEYVSQDNPWTHRDFLDVMRTGWNAQCLITANELVGYFVAMPGVDEVHLLNISVAPAFRGRGCALVMLESLLPWARERKARWLWLEVRVSNTRALKIYERFGFIRMGLRKSYYRTALGGQEDAILMNLTL